MSGRRTCVLRSIAKDCPALVAKGSKAQCRPAPCAIRATQSFKAEAYPVHLSRPSRPWKRGHFPYLRTRLPNKSCFRLRQLIGYGYRVHLRLLSAFFKSEVSPTCARLPAYKVLHATMRPISRLPLGRTRAAVEHLSMPSSTNLVPHAPQPACMRAYNANHRVGHNDTVDVFRTALWHLFSASEHRTGHHIVAGLASLPVGSGTAGLSRKG